MRLFAALLPPEEAVEHLDEFLAPRRDAAPFRWTVPDQVHLTLAFMGEVHERSLDDLLARLGAAAARHTAVSTRIAGGGAFPHVSGARVLWTGLALDDSAREEVGRLAAGARAAGVTAGARVDGRAFRPHLTVARLGRPAEVTRWVRLLDAYEGPAWTADTLALVESHLGEGPHRRPRHEVVDAWTLSPGMD